MNQKTVWCIINWPHYKHTVQSYDLYIQHMKLSCYKKLIQFYTKMLAATQRGSDLSSLFCILHFKQNFKKLQPDSLHIASLKFSATRYRCPYQRITSPPLKWMRPDISDVTGACNYKARNSNNKYQWFRKIG